MVKTLLEKLQSAKKARNEEFMRLLSLLDNNQVKQLIVFLEANVKFRKELFK